MAGRAIQRTRLEQLDKMGEDEVFRLYLEHGSTVAMCKAIFTPTDPNAKRWGTDELYRWLRVTPERWQAWQANKEARAEIEVDLALDEAQAADTDNVQVQRLKVDVHKWRAGILNREYRPGQSNVNVQVGVQVGVAWLQGLEKAALVGKELKGATDGE
jgi:hypothetical protein